MLRVRPFQRATGLRQTSICWTKIAERFLHVSSTAQFQVKKLDQDGKAHYSGDNKFKQGTPKRTAGPIDNFNIVSSHSRYVNQASAIPADSQGGAPYSIDNLESGRVYQYPIEPSKKLSKLGSYLRGQGSELFKEHSSLIRESTSLKMLEKVKKGTQVSSKENRICITGDRGIGKSTLLAQTHAFAAEKGYVIISIPRAEELIDGNSDALYSKKHGMFAQSMIAKRLMNKIARANKDVLLKLKPSEAVTTSTGTFQQHSTSAMKSLYHFLMEGKGRRDAFDVLNDFMNEVSHQNSAPVLFSLDNLNAITDSVFSSNKDTSNRPIKALSLQIPGYFFDFLSGARSFKKGLVVGVTTGRHTHNATIKAGLGLDEAPAYASRKEYDYELSPKFNGVENLTVNRLSQSEINALLDYYFLSKVITEELTDTLRSEKYFLSGSGNPRSLLRACTPNSY